MIYGKLEALTTGDNVIVPAVTGKKVRLHSYVFVCSDATVITWKDTAGNELSGPMSFVANGGAVVLQAAGTYQSQMAQFETVVDTGLVLNQSALSTTGGHIVYDYIKV
jgi:hypothetical protein